MWRYQQEFPISPATADGLGPRTIGFGFTLTFWGHAGQILAQITL